MQSVSGCAPRWRFGGGRPPACQVEPRLGAPIDQPRQEAPGNPEAAKGAQPGPAPGDHVGHEKRAAGLASRGRQPAEADGAARHEEVLVVEAAKGGERRPLRSRLRGGGGSAEGRKGVVDLGATAAAKAPCKAGEFGCNPKPYAPSSTLATARHNRAAPDTIPLLTSVRQA
jgi:hypothetical protein